MSTEKTGDVVYADKLLSYIAYGKVVKGKRQINGVVNFNLFRPCSQAKRKMERDRQKTINTEACI